MDSKNLLGFLLFLLLLGFSVGEDAGEDLAESFYSDMDTDTGEQLIASVVESVLTLMETASEEKAYQNFAEGNGIQFSLGVDLRNGTKLPVKGIINICNGSLDLEGLSKKITLDDAGIVVNLVGNVTLNTINEIDLSLMSLKLESYGAFNLELEDLDVKLTLAVEVDPDTLIVNVTKVNLDVGIGHAELTADDTALNGNSDYPSVLDSIAYLYETVSKTGAVDGLLHRVLNPLLSNCTILQLAGPGRDFTCLALNGPSPIGPAEECLARPTPTTTPVTPTTTTSSGNGMAASIFIAAASLVALVFHTL